MKAFKILLLFIAFSVTNLVAAQSVYTTKTGEKYHKSNCRYLKYSKKEFTLERAKELGYLACSVCKPYKGATTSNYSSGSNGYTPSSQPKSPPKTSSARQCSGKTKAGNRCKRRTKSSSGRCYQH